MGKVKNVLLHQVAYLSLYQGYGTMALKTICDLLANSLAEFQSLFYAYFQVASGFFLPPILFDSDPWGGN